MRLDHVNIHVHDLAAARDFLVKLLGVEVGWRPSFKVPGDWLYLEGRPVLTDLKRVSTPGRRHSVGATEVPRGMSGQAGFNGELRGFGSSSRS